MKKDTSIYGMALLCLLIFSGCGKKNNPVDIEKPVVHTPAPITITLPKDSVTNPKRQLRCLMKDQTLRWQKNW
jgi:PBP1b-binding outer membrane lipoprotein LpoB